MATLEMGLIYLGRLTALGEANNSLMASTHLKEAAKIAGVRRPVLCLEMYLQACLLQHA